MGHNVNFCSWFLWIGWSSFFCQVFQGKDSKKSICIHKICLRVNEAVLGRQRSWTSVQSPQRPQILQGACKLGWPFRVIPPWNKRARPSEPQLLTHCWMQAVPKNSMVIHAAYATSSWGMIIFLLNGDVSLELYPEYSSINHPWLKYLINWSGFKAPGKVDIICRNGRFYWETEPSV